MRLTNQTVIEGIELKKNRDEIEMKNLMLWTKVRTLSTAVLSSLEPLMTRITKRGMEHTNLDV